MAWRVRIQAFSAACLKQHVKPLGALELVHL
jgi:hypothetical protein